MSYIDIKAEVDIYNLSSHTNVLHLDNITYKDIIKQQEFSDKLLFNVDNDNIYDGLNLDNIEYKKMPIIFKNMAEWDTTNLSCYFCTLTINKHPVPTSLKIEYENNGVDIKFVVDQLFCSFNCAYAYLLTKFSCDVNKNKYINILKEIYHKFYGRRIQVFQPSPDKSVLKYHGGSLTPKEYEACILSLSEADIYANNIIDRINS